MRDRKYSLYHLRRDGQVGGAVDRAFEDDIEALVHAAAMLEEHPGIEVWQTERLVGRLGHRRPTAAARP